MSTPEHRRSHETWRLTRSDGETVVLRFVGGISRDELALLYPGRECEPIKGGAKRPSGDHGEAGVA